MSTAASINYAAHGLNPPRIASCYYNQTTFGDTCRSSKVYHLECPTINKGGVQCGKVGRLTVTMKTSNDKIGEKLHSAVYLISVKCKHCKTEMDLYNEDFDPDSCNETILYDSGFTNDTNKSKQLFCLKSHKAKGSSILPPAFQDTTNPFTTVAFLATTKESSVFYLTKEDQREYNKQIAYFWQNAVSEKESLRGKDYFFEEEERLYLYPVNAFKRSIALNDWKNDFSTHLAEFSKKHPALTVKQLVSGYNQRYSKPAHTDQGLVNLTSGVPNQAGYTQDQYPQPQTGQYQPGHGYVEQNPIVNPSDQHAHRQYGQGQVTSTGDTLSGYSQASSWEAGPLWQQARRVAGIRPRHQFADPRAAPLSSDSIRLAQHHMQSPALTTGGPANVSGIYELPTTRSRVTGELEGNTPATREEGVEDTAPVMSANFARGFQGWEPWNYQE